MRSSPWKPSRRPERARRAAGVVLASLLLVAPGRSQPRPADPGEATDLRVTKAGAGLRLTWQPPIDPVDSYQVRRCTLPSLNVTYYGNCVVEGLTAPSWEEPVPEGNVFYLVSPSVAGVEGPLGFSFDGGTWRPRWAPDCASRETAGPMTIRIWLEEPRDVCATQVRLAYPAGAVAFTSGACAGLTESFLGASNDDGATVFHACASTGVDPPTGPGVITEMVFQRNECPLRRSAFRVISCELMDCVTFELSDAECTVR